MKRRSLLTTGALLACANLTGCATAKLFEDDKYQETVDRFLVSENGKKLVVLGQRYHYILDMPEHLQAVLEASYRQSVTAAFYGFVADGDKISGKFKLYVRRDRTRMTEGDRQRALVDGFTQHGGNLELVGSVSGTRYRTDGFKQEQVPSAFNEPYRIDVVETMTSAGKAVRLLATPVTLTVDGVLMIGAVVLFPVGMTLAKLAATGIGP
ncbi:hypothetical protein B7R77_04265 [Ralstonia solanacearum K60]|uniref:5-formyltetrahydrofolate cyclo-ligase n=1 Tax=Ralstonia solanacearum K60 TaxID=1091042 RepID=A0AAP8D3G1_RALSL|nr:hypothetical protein [Ralstonia solanacearum]OYQ12546.1 hypothetical protein B7R77_04265 [Ralstonia solanacearum K60]CCF96795.1 conserved exported hypothetical protein [Ralstonia solanacearum K60]